MNTQIVIALLNRLASRSRWVQQQLPSHAGKSIRFQIEHLMDVSVTITPEGSFAPVTHNKAADVTLVISPELLPDLAANNSHAFHEISVNGDQSLAETILYLGKSLHGEIESDLSSLLGDILAHRIALAGRELIQWHFANVHNISHALTKFLTEEKPVVASKTQLRRHATEIDALLHQVSQLESKIHKLSVSRTHTH